MFDPVWLASFVKVAETLSFTRAADRLGVGQSTVSEHVRKLEATCGRRLFRRDTHGVALTADGEAMLGFATSILETSTRAMGHFANRAVQGVIRLGVSEDVVLTGLTDVLRRFVLLHPHVRLELTVGVSETLRAALSVGDLDLIFLKRRVGESHGDLVWREPLIWITARDFDLDPAQPVPLIALAPPALTRSMALAVLERQGRHWYFACTSASQSGVHAAVAAGLGIAPHAQSLAPAGVRQVADDLLPTLGEIEFVVMAGRAANRGAARILYETLWAGGDAMRSRSALQPA